MALINTTTTGVLGTTVYGDGQGALTVQKDGVTQGVYGNIPAVYITTSSGTSLSSSTWTKITLNTKQFDTNNNFDTSNYRFTPTVAGYYNVNATINFNVSSGAGKNQIVQLYKNGSGYQGMLGVSSSSDWVAPCLSCLVYMNGTTDYIELYGYQNTGSTVTSVTSYTWFQAYLVKAA